MKKRTKKLLSVGLIGVMTLSLAACGNKNETKDTKSEGSGELNFTSEETATLEDWGAAVKN